MHLGNSEQARWLRENVLPHEAMLRGYLREHFPTVADADDVIQESMIRVLRARERGEIIFAKAFLFTTARNLAYDIVRRQQVVAFEPITELTASSVFTDEADVGETVSKKQEFDLLTKAIQSLPERCRQVVTLRTAYGLSQKQIAGKLGISENTVEKQLANGVRGCSEFFANLGML
jgi:RNA polymerase sigma factor (sigma-70 family)